MTHTLLNMFTIAACLSAAACSSDLGTGTFDVPLTYLDGESNYGPTEATGSAFIDPNTGVVEIDVAGLPTLSGEVYEGWLAGGLETAVSTGRFNTDAMGVGMSTITLGSIVEDNFTKVVVTVEPDPESDPGPDSRHSIAGEIPKD